MSYRCIKLRATSQAAWRLSKLVGSAPPVGTFVAADLPSYRSTSSISNCANASGASSMTRWPQATEAVFHSGKCLTLAYAAWVTGDEKRSAKT